MKRALFSLYYKDGSEKFALFLQEKGFEILSTGGTYRYLAEKGVKVTEVSAATGFPEILDGRVKTLHPAIHAGILAIRSKPSHTDELEKLDIPMIDYVVVNLYPFEETVGSGKSSFEEIIEQIDIGGVALIRAAAKNFQDVAVIVDNGDFERVMKETSETSVLSRETRLELAAKAFSHTAYYDSLISTYFNRLAGRQFPSEYGLPLKIKQSLRYGENPHQEAMLYRSYVDGNITAPGASILWGKEMSYNNFLDADACIDILREFAEDRPFAVIIKHTNPCGSALSGSLKSAYEKALSCDPSSAFGGIIGVNRKMDKETASMIGERFYEIIVAPDYDEEALKILEGKKNLRILKLNGNDWNKRGMAMRRIEGGMLVQGWDGANVKEEKWDIVTKKAPAEQEFSDLKFAFKICKYVKSNAIVYVKNGQTIGVGAGQMSRVDSARLALIKAGEAGFDPKGAVMASDAYFPFRDSVDSAASSGISAIVQPGGSIRDEDSIKAADEHGIAMVFTGTRHFRH